jgi:transposase
LGDWKELLMGSGSQSKFLLRTGRRPVVGMKTWTEPYMAWVRQVRFERPAQQAALEDYLHEVDHMAARVKRLEHAITEAVKLASPQVQEVVEGLQALRGIAEISAVTIVAELGQISRFDTARQLMGYSGAVPSEDSSGKRKRQGSITKTGNAHLRRIVVEASWSYRHRPAIGPRLRKRQERVPEPIKEIAWKAQVRLHKRYIKFVAAGKDQRKIITAVGRELLGFIWAIGTKVEVKQQIAA